MRLVDKVAQTREPFMVELYDEVLALPGAGDFADEIRATPLRYVVSDDVRRICTDLVRRWPDLLDPSDPFLRLAAQQFWVEWVEGAGQQVGVLIRTSSEGRAGAVHTFWSDKHGAALAQASIRFDFDDRSHQDSRPLAAASSHDGLPTAMAEAVAVDIHPCWESYFARSRANCEARRAAVRHCAEVVLADFPFILAFSRLLQSPGNFAMLPISRKALNVSRTKQKRPALLDHIEVSLCLGAGTAKYSDRHSAGGKHCRRHIVRGHFVRRYGNIFWRSSHYRGDPKSAEFLTRTVNASTSRALKEATSGGNPGLSNIMGFRQSES